MINVFLVLKSDDSFWQNISRTCIAVPRYYDRGSGVRVARRKSVGNPSGAARLSRICHVTIPTNILRSGAVRSTGHSKRTISPRPITPATAVRMHHCSRSNGYGNVVFDADFYQRTGEMFCPFSSGAPPRSIATQSSEQQRPLNLKHLSEAVRTLTSPPVSTRQRR